MGLSGGDDKFDTETAFDRAMRKMEERDARIDRFVKSPLEEALDRMNQQNELLGADGLLGSHGLSGAVASASELAQAIAPLQNMLYKVSSNLSAALEPLASLKIGSVENVGIAMKSMGSIISAIITAETMVASDPSIYHVLDSLTHALEPYNSYAFWSIPVSWRHFEPLLRHQNFIVCKRNFQRALGAA